ncbi:MAG: Uma2 family endonuclease [Clostridia bacterium]|nr:MAG: Uma2 family endonuclease [Clostridia bacterium]
MGLVAGFDEDELKETAARYRPEAGRPVPPGKMSFEEFLAWGDEDTWAEWVDGEVTLLSPAATKHQRINVFLSSFLSNYVLLKKLGQVLTAPFVIRLPEPVGHGREPDIIFIREENLAHLRPTYFAGAPDLVVEITSPESLARDRGEKFKEYERAGVPEYWLVDPDKEEAEFYCLSDHGRYSVVMAGREGIYRSRVIAGLRLKIEWLWADPPLAGIEALAELGVLPQGRQ